MLTPPGTPCGSRPIGDARVRKLADQILRICAFVASQETKIQAKVQQLAKALGHPIEDTEALQRQLAIPMLILGLIAWLCTPFNVGFFFLIPFLVWWLVGLSCVVGWVHDYNAALGHG